MRYFLEIAYKGTHYHGWQIQENALSVQEVLNNCLSELLSEETSTTGSGRTDTGVHALQQFVHFDSQKELSARKHLHALNGMLPKDIVINSIKRVDDQAHARFDAIERSYLYRMAFKKDAFRHGLVSFYSFKPDLGLMNQAAEKMLGEKNFASFSKVRTQVDNFVCDIRAARWQRKKDEYHFQISANRFLRGMVRTMVGTMVEIGAGKMKPDQVTEILASEDRTKAGPSAPPEGLYLASVRYPDGYFK